MSLSVERLEALADNEAACAESLLHCADYDHDEDLQSERQARIDTEAALRELIAIKKAQPVFYAYQQADGGEMFWHSARDLATAEIRSDGAVYPLIRKPE